MKPFWYSDSIRYQYLQHLNTNRRQVYHDKVSSWLTVCNATHTKCNSDGSSELWGDVERPTRLLQLGPEKDMVRLASGTGIFDKYVALSYCWGNCDFITTTKKNLRQHQEGLHRSALPQLFNDAIDVVLSQRVSYLWIDALCIVQDDLSEWAEEASRMAGVYSNAFFTIAATVATNPHMHLLTRKARITFRPDSTRADVEYTGGPTGSRAWDDFESINSAALHKRAWCVTILQSLAQAPRTFGSGQN